MKKKVLSLFLTLAMVIAILPAVRIPVSATPGDFVSASFAYDAPQMSLQSSSREYLSALKVTE